MSGRRAHALRAVLGAGDVVSAVAAACSAYALRFHVLDAWLPVTGRTDILPARYLAALPAATLLLLLATICSGLHHPTRISTLPRLADLLRLAGFGTAALATVVLLYWSEFQYSRLTLVLTAGLHPVFLALARRLLRRVGARAVAVPTLLIGGGRPARTVVAAARDAAAPVSITAFCPVGDDATPPGASRIASIDDAVGAALRGEFREVVVAFPAEHAAAVPALLTRLEQSTADLRLVPDLGDAVLVNPGATIVGGVPVLSIRERPLYGLRAAAKRALDCAVAGVTLALAAPLLAAIALAVKATSRGPAFFAQERMGLDGRPFRMFKFRTMRADAEARTGPVFARRGDPRATPLGRILRRFSLDELPQLWNVLRGEMSLVGPRPERPPFIEQFRAQLPGYMLRHTVKSGMTGWAQVHGFRGDSSLETRLRYDLEYVDRWSLSLDLEILGRTAFQVLAGRNAH